MIALNSICASACSSTTRPCGVLMLRRCRLRGSTSSGRAGRPGRSAGATSVRAASQCAASWDAARSTSAWSAPTASALASGSRSRRASSAAARQLARLWAPSVELMASENAEFIAKEAKIGKKSTDARRTCHKRVRHANPRDRGSGESARTQPFTIRDSPGPQRS
ncbi:hypothetical protein PSAC2689_90151 [Paraburkholderia sacchari]